MALVNVLPGATATQLGIFLGYVRGGWWGGLLAGLCFAAPAFLVMLALTIAYATIGVSPILRGALYGLGPVVLGYLLRRLCSASADGTALARTASSPSGRGRRPPQSARRAAILLSPAASACFFFHQAPGRSCSSRCDRPHPVSFAGVVAAPARRRLPSRADARALVALFSTHRRVHVRGGLTMIALLEEHVVNQLHWLTSSRVLDGLLWPAHARAHLMCRVRRLQVLGSPAPRGAAAIFLPSFLLMLALFRSSIASGSHLGASVIKASSRCHRRDGRRPRAHDAPRRSRPRCHPRPGRDARPLLYGSWSLAAMLAARLRRPPQPRL